MDEVYVEIKDTYYQSFFRNKDFVSVEELLQKIIEIDDEKNSIIEEFEDFKKEVEDNYRPMTSAELYDVHDKDFH